MHIFIDETGSFVLTNDFPSPSLVGALIIPDFQLAHVERRYEKLRKSFPKERGKVKGRLLDEKEISSVIAMLERNSVIYEVTSVEMPTHSVEGIEAYRSKTACGLTQNLTSEHHDNLVAEVWSLRHRLESLPIQLFVQTMATFNLLRRVIENATLYWCQRVPSELGKFAWIIDAKGNQNSPTAWEKWWSTIVLPYMQANCLRKPIGHISWAITAI
jgi:hypothetical protein